MKWDEMSKYDELVVAKMRELLKSKFDQEVDGNRGEILAAASKLDTSEINELVFALRRIEKGVYGQCVICRHDIQPDILKLNPTARLCLSCESAMNDKTLP